MPSKLRTVRSETSCLGYVACMIVVRRERRLFFAAATCIDQSEAFVTNFAERTFGAAAFYRGGPDVYNCQYAKADGQCNLDLAKQACPVTCGLCGALCRCFVAPWCVPWVMISIILQGSPPARMHSLQLSSSAYHIISFVMKPALVAVTSILLRIVGTR